MSTLKTAEHELKHTTLNVVQCNESEAWFLKKTEEQKKTDWESDR